MSILTQLLTGADNVTHDIGRWLAGLMGLTGLGLQAYCTFTGKPFDMQGYGVGCGALVTGVGAALRLKETTEPKP